MCTTELEKLFQTSGDGWGITLEQSAVLHTKCFPTYRRSSAHIRQINAWLVAIPLIVCYKLCNDSEERVGKPYLTDCR